MAHPMYMLVILRVLVFAALMIFSWALWFAYWPSTHSQNAVWQLLASIALLFAYSFVLFRRERALAWLCWLSVLAMLLLGLWLPSN